MAKRRVRDLSVGTLFALALIILAFAVMAVGGESRLFGTKARYQVVFPNADGLVVGSPVKMAGVHWMPPSKSRHSWATNNTALQLPIRTYYEYPNG